MLQALILAAAITGGVDAPMQKSAAQKSAVQKSVAQKAGVGVDVSRRGVFVRVRSERRHVRLLAGRRCRGARCR